MKLKENLSTKLESTSDRAKMMKKRISYLMTEHDMNQKLLNAHTTQLETENHHYQLSCSTESSFRQEARDFEKEWKKVNETVLGIKNELEKMTKKIELSKKTIKYDEKSLREWEEMLNQNEDNNQLIEQYMKEDLKEYKEQELKRQKLSKELVSYREAIVKMTNESREMEIALDRTTKLYDQALTEYRQMFNQWKESVVMLQQKNDDIKKLLQETETLREITNDKKQALEESEKFLKEQIENNKQTEESIKKFEKDLGNMKEEQTKKKETISIYENELIIQQNVVKDLTQRLQQIRANIKRKRTEIQNKYAKIENLEKQIVDLTAKLQDVDSQKLNIEEKAKELENMIEEQEKKNAAMIREVHRLQAANVRVTNQMRQLENESRLLKMQCQNESKKIEYLDKLRVKNEKTLEETRENSYHVEYELQRSEMKLERLKGLEQSKSEEERKQSEIDELESNLDQKLEISKLLQKQTTSLEFDMRKMSNCLARDSSELEYLRNKRQDFVLLVDAGEKQLKSVQNHYEEKQVEESILRLKVSQMEKMISNLGSNVYDLEKYQLELEAAIRERKAEIAIEKESLVIQKRVVTSECSELRSAIAERRIRINQLQARYSCTLAMLGTNPDGTPINTTYLKIQNAQERYLLQEQGDKLDETIRKTEQEIQAMENTLRVVNTCNDKYKMTLTSNEKEKPEMEESKKLDEELYDAEQRLKEKEEELHLLKNSLQKLQNDYDQMLRNVEEAQELKENKTQYLVELKQQIHDQEGKVLRATKSLQNVQKNIHQRYVATNDQILLMQQKEVELREIQEQNSIALQDIAEFTIHHVEAELYIKKLLAVKNIELPSVSLFSQSPISSLRYSITNSIDHPPKSTNRGSIIASSRGSIGNIVNIQPEFEVISIKRSLKRDVKHEQPVKDSVHAQTTRKI